MKQRNFSDMRVFALLFCYFLAFASIRLLVSSTMELDEAEQFLNGAVFQWGYQEEAPLYSWLVKIISTVSGLNIFTLVTIKYSLIFLFYGVFYWIARSFWDQKKSFTVTASLMLFPVYLYEFNRDLSHTILATLIAAISCLIFIRMLSDKKIIYYVFFGLFIGLGILSKYTFLFFVAIFGLAAISCHEGRRIILNVRMIFTVMVCLIVLLPHLLWLLQNDLPTVHHALNAARAGTLENTSAHIVFRILAMPYLEILLFITVFTIFFGRHLSNKMTGEDWHLIFFRRMAFWVLIVPVIIVFVLKAGHFTVRWLSPVYITIPLASFSMVFLNEEKNHYRYFTILCISLALGVMIVRAVIGFAPDVSGKVERIHVPFHSMALQLKETCRGAGMHDLSGMSIIADDKDFFIAANILAELPGTQFVSLRTFTKEPSKIREILHGGGVIVWNKVKFGESISKGFTDIFPSAVPIHLEAPYLHSQRNLPYVLGAAIIPASQN